MLLISLLENFFFFLGGGGCGGLLAAFLNNRLQVHKAEKWALILQRLRNNRQECLKSGFPKESPLSTNNLVLKPLAHSILHDKML